MCIGLRFTGYQFNQIYFLQDKILLKDIYPVIQMAIPLI